MSEEIQKPTEKGMLTQPVKEKQGENLLKKEKSPYLRQHKDNPVWWYPWGEKAFADAKKENKVVFLSVGYSTCHWCHVMEKESFENPEVAKVLNDHFIAVKVDREERPDVDAIYMAAVQRMTGSGGWPMSVFMTPDRKPFYGGTYFPKDHFIQILKTMARLWRSETSKVRSSAKEVAALIERETQVAFPDSTQPFQNEVFSEFVNFHRARFDGAYGGFGSRPKFPQTMNLQALMRICYRLKDSKTRMEIQQWVEKTLDGMSQGGMYDHLKGGFHRYSTDEKWLVPHFEKMLYDNALLATTFIEAFQYYRKPEYARVAEEVFQYVLKQMTHPKGGFYSAEDADSRVLGKKEKSEGFHYVYGWAELKKALKPQELAALKKVYGVSERGNFEGHNILNLQAGFTHLTQKKNRWIRSAFKKLERIRRKKPAPMRDDKVITAWNGLMIAAFARGYQAFGKPAYLKTAQQAAQFVLRELVKDGKLQRRWIDGEARFPAYADDYAGFIHALIELYQSDFDPQWLAKARELQALQDKLFWDPKGAGYFQDDGSDKTLLVRVKDSYDGVVPAASSLGAYNLLRLHDLTYHKPYKDRAEKILQLMYPRLESFPSSLSQMVLALDYYMDRSKEIAIIGRRNEATVKRVLSYLRKNFIPNKVIALGRQGTKEVPLLAKKVRLRGKPTVYVCEGSVCLLPANDLVKVKKQVSGRVSL